MTVLLLVLLLAAPDLDAAEKALAAGKPEEALQILGDLADAKEPDVRALVVQGRAKLALLDYQAAAEPLARASDKRPEDKALARDATLACIGAADGAYARLYLEDAKRLVQRAGDDALLADIEFAREDYEAALVLYGKQTTLHAQMRAADCLKLLGRDAKEAYGTALEAAIAAGDMATAYVAGFASGRGGRVLQWLDGRIEANPDDLQARYYRGFARSERQMFPEAVEDLRFYLSKSPSSVAAKDRLGFALVQNGYALQDKVMIREAAALSREVLDVEPGNRDAWERLSYIARYAWDNGEVEWVFEVTKDLHARDPAETQTAVNYAMCARRLGRYDEARAVYDVLLRETPNDAMVLTDYGIFLDGLGDRDGALRCWRKALEGEPENLDALENLFTDAWERGDTAAARDYARRGLAAAKAAKGAVDRWLWFEDRLRWAPVGFRG